MHSRPTVSPLGSAVRPINTIANLAALSSPDVLVALSYAPAGLGHLRVVDAMREGMPPAQGPVLLGAQDRGIATVHRLVSVNPLLKRLFEWCQQGIAERMFTPLVRGMLRLRPEPLKSQVDAILSQRFERPRTLVAIATHFAAAHQFAAIRGWLMREWNVRLVLVVQVTDASPQRIWYVPGADLICVPSEGTRRDLVAMAQASGLAPAEVRVLPYPVGPSFAHALPGGAALRERLLSPTGVDPISVCVPVSGAAVGLAFSNELILGLQTQEPRFRIEVVSQDSPFTGPFLERMRQQARVHVNAAREDLDVIRAYQRVYASGPICVEVTKPSEHSFKTLCSPDQIGGALLMFAEPVQRQEYDNLDFLRLHGLLPSHEEGAALWAAAQARGAVDPDTLTRAASWRALELPRNPTEAAAFISWALRCGLLQAMARARIDGSAARAATELSPHGIADFWDEVARLV